MLARIALSATLLVAAGGLHAQETALVPADRLRAVLPEAVTQRILRRIERARADRLPARTLEQRALELAAKGVLSADIERAIQAQAEAQDAGRAALIAVGRPEPSEDEVDAASTAIAAGVDRRAVAELARASPADRSLTVPLYVVASLVDRGLPADGVLEAVRARLEVRADDAELRRIAIAGGTAKARRDPLGPGSGLVGLTRGKSDGWVTPPPGRVSGREHPGSSRPRP